MATKYLSCGFDPLRGESSLCTGYVSLFLDIGKNATSDERQECSSIETELLGSLRG